MNTGGRQEQVAILDTVCQALVRGAESAEALEKTLKRCAANLRVGQSSEVLGELTDAIANLALITELVGQLRRGLLASNMEGAPLSRWQTPASAQAFQEIVTALEAGDWVFLSDLLEYEICPLVTETGAEMSLLLDDLRVSGPAAVGSDRDNSF
jgi:hypothetical protein